MLNYFLIYLIAGLVIMYVTACIHLYKAYCMGYDLDLIGDYFKNGIKNECSNIAIMMLKIMYGWLLWPVRLTQFLLDQDWYFNEYSKLEVKESE